jgi:hypothetical protein
MAQSRSLPLLVAAAAAACLNLSACGAGSSDPPSGTSDPASASTQSASSSGAGSSSSSTSSSTSSSASSSSGSSSSSSGSSSSSAASGSSGGSSAAAALANKLGLPHRLLIGLGAQSGSGPSVAVLSQNIKLDIDEKYLVGAGPGDWTTWNSPAGAYIGAAAAEAASLGAVPMFTLYQMATNGDGNLTDLNDSSFMSIYWANVKLMFQNIGALGKPTLVNFEPDFWGYTQQRAPNGDPTQLFAYVNINPDCATLSNDVVGIVACLIGMARKYAPLAYVGFPPSDWAHDQPSVIAYMNTIGTQHADFIVAQSRYADGVVSG